MHFTKLTIMPLMAVDFVLGATTTLEAPLSGYTAIDLQWNVQINSSTPSIAVNGTVQDVVAHLAAVYPEYVATFKENIARRKIGGGRVATAAAAATATVQNRQTDIVPEGTDYYCNNFEDAWYEDIQAGVSYLEGLSGVPSVAPGPRTCGRVSCSWDSAIWWCNDNAETKSLNSFFDVAIGALEIMEHCTITVEGESISRMVNGQQFFRDGWNVIITSANC